MRWWLSCQLLAASCCLLTSARWTEEEENQRIATIKEMEWKAFENQLNKQKNFRSQQSLAYSQQRAEQKPSRPQALTEKQRETTVEETEENWCYHCTSPIGHLSDAMKRTIKDFLKLRRTSYPTEVSTPECVSARNFSRLSKQSCRHRYCQTVSLINKEEGTSFVLRGCAENFGAIDVKALEAQRENACTKLHDRVDISECICKERKYCYANERRSSSLLSPSLLTISLVLLLLS